MSYKNQVKKILKEIRNKERYFSESRNLLMSLWHAREGGHFSKVLVGLSAIGSFTNMLLPKESYWDEMRDKGLESVDYSKVIRSLILKSLISHKSIEDLELDSSDIKFSKVFRHEGKDMIILSDFKDSWTGQSIYLEPNGGKEYLAKLLKEIIWTDKREIEVTLESNGGAGNIDFVFTELKEPGPYLCKKSPEYYAKRLMSYKDMARTVLFRGPSGVGKGVLARHVSKLIAHDSRTLKFSADVLRYVSTKDIIGLMDLLEPTVLLLDDLELSSNISSHLAMFEMLSKRGCLIIVTEMTNQYIHAENLKRGDFYHPGMRPGRIDEIFNILLPDYDERIVILKHYFGEHEISPPEELMKNLVAGTEDLSGAYLKALVERICTHGFESWEHELEQILFSAPKFGEDEEGGEIAKEGLTEAEFAAAIASLKEEEFYDEDDGELIDELVRETIAHTKTTKAYLK